MTSPHHSFRIEEHIEQWRSFMLRREDDKSYDVAYMERRLREEMSKLAATGLPGDEAFLVATKRLAQDDDLFMQFALEYSPVLIKRCTLTQDSKSRFEQSKSSALMAFLFAVAAAMAVKVPALFGIEMDDRNPEELSFYIRNASFFVLPLLAAYFTWKRKLTPMILTGLAVTFVAAAFFANIYPTTHNDSTFALTTIHLPIILWLTVGIAYAGRRWCTTQGRMDFIRFSGELFIYFVLIALGGGVFTAFLGMIFHAIGINAGPFIGFWLLPCGAAGALVISAWLAESKQNVMENMAPVLTRIFTPLFTAVLIVFLGTLVWTGRGISIEREVLISFDLLLVVVLGLVVYSISSRNPKSPPNGFDFLQLILLISALLADAVMLWAIAARITEFGFTPNRVAALGENIILLINLAWSAVLYIRFLIGRGSFNILEKWQTDYLVVYGLWAALIVVVFPPLFGYR